MLNRSIQGLAIEHAVVEIMYVLLYDDDDNGDDDDQRHRL